MKNRLTYLYTSLAGLVVLLFVVDILTGAVRISPMETVNALFGGEVSSSTLKIVREIRLNKALTAILVGTGLSVSGLLMQTLFRNPLAGPYVLGVSSGASLGVALFILGIPVAVSSGAGIAASVSLATAAWIGSALMLILISVLSRNTSDIMTVLVLGMMLSSGVDAVVQILQYLSNETALKSFVVWTMGSLGEVGQVQLAILLLSCACGLVLALCCAKPLNLLLAGEGYAHSVGLDLKQSRNKVFIATVLLAGTVTAFCGPVGFVGLVVPHICRSLFRRYDHLVLIPACALCGSAVMLLCDVISKLFVLPINSITAVLGIPIVVWIVFRRK